MSEKLNPYQVMDQRAQAHIEDVAATAAAEQADFAKQSAIDARYNSLEVRDLNDAAHAEVFGEEGVLAQIKENPRYGSAEADRVAAAQEYESTIIDLVEEQGFDISQAKLIMDLRDADAEAAPTMTANYIKQGMGVAEAEEKVNQTYAKKDAQRRTLFKQEGIFTTDDYQKVRSGEDLYGDPTAVTESEPVAEPEPEIEFEPVTEPEPAPEAEEPTPKTPAEVARDAYNIEEMQELGFAEQEYVTLLAKRSRTLVGKRKGQQELEAARTRFENARTAVNKRIETALLNSDFTDDQINDEVDRQEIGDAATKGDLGRLTDLVEAETARASKRSRFIDWWVRQEGATGFLKKAGVMIPAGVVVGAAVGATAGVGVGAAAAGVIAGRLAKGVAAGKLSAEERSATLGQQRAQARYQEQRKRTQESLNTGSRTEISSAFQEGAAKDVAQNRRRFAISAAIGAIAGASAGILLNDTVQDKIGDVFDRNNGPSGVHTEKTHFDHEFKLQGDGTNPDRLQIVHENPGEFGNDTSPIRLQDAQGRVIADNLELTNDGLTDDSVAKIQEAGYSVEVDQDGAININQTPEAVELADADFDAAQVSQVMNQVDRLGEGAAYSDISGSDRTLLNNYLNSQLTSIPELESAYQAAGGDYGQLSAEQWAALRALLEDNK